MEKLHSQLDQDIKLSLKTPNYYIPDFDKIRVSTKTFIVMTNLKIDIEQLFYKLNVIDYKTQHKKRGRKKKGQEKKIIQQVNDGDIISIKYRDKFKGSSQKKNKKKNKKNYFRNSLTIEIWVDNKFINVKISRNGKFQLTGCKFDKQAVYTIKLIYNKFITIIKQTNNLDNNSIIPIIDQEIPKKNNLEKTFNHPEHNSHLSKTQNMLYINKSTFKSINNNKDIHKFTALFIPAMRNIDFKFGFPIDRKKLDMFMNQHTDYRSLLEEPFGYTGVNIKIPILKNISELKICRIILDKHISKDTLQQKNIWNRDTITNQQYLTCLAPKDRIKRQKKKNYVSILAFHSGSCIVTGISKYFSRDEFYIFYKLVMDNKDEIKEKLRY